MKWIFENKVYNSLDEFNGKTITVSANNFPEPVFTLDDLKSLQRYEPYSRFDSLEVDEDEDGRYIKWEDIENLFFNKKVDVGEGPESASEL